MSFYVLSILLAIPFVNSIIFLPNHLNNTSSQEAKIEMNDEMETNVQSLINSQDEIKEESATTENSIDAQI